MGKHVDRAGRLCCLLLVAALLGCDKKKSDSADAPPPTGYLRSDVRQVIVQLQTMPAWNWLPNSAHDSMCRDECYERYWQQVSEACMEQIAVHDIETIRAGVKRYLEGARYATGVANDQELSKIFVLNSYLFDLPEVMAWEDAVELDCVDGYWGRPFLGDDRRNPKASDKVLTRWPWSVNDRGEWRLTGRYRPMGGSFPKYNALTVFDGLAERYGKRDTVGRQE